MFTATLLLALSWGALSFGAVYPWAYQPLQAALIALGLWGMFAPKKYPQRPNGIIAVGFALLIAAIVLQLIPVSLTTLQALSPAAHSFLQLQDLSYKLLVAGGSAANHSLSIGASDTLVGLSFVVTLGIFLIGLTRMLDGLNLRTMLPWLIALGTLLALIGIIQKPLFNGRIYGFWTPSAGPILYSPTGGPFGPFINRNHFAGWMLMALPLAIGYFTATIANDKRATNSGWRERIIWLSSRDANHAALVGFAILLMGLSLMMTLSRSGIGCFMIALAISGVVVARRQIGHWKSAFVVSYLVFVAILIASWAGIDAIATRFQAVNWTLQGRLFVWQDALRVFHLFPWTGTGLNTYGTAMLVYQTFETETVHFAQAHNDYLQLLAEGGLLLVIPALALITIFIREVRQRFREGDDDTTGYWLRVGAVTGIAAVSLQEIVDFSLQMPGNAALFVLLCGIASRKAHGRARSRGGSASHELGQ